MQIVLVRRSRFGDITEHKKKLFCGLSKLTGTLFVQSDNPSKLWKVGGHRIGVEALIHKKLKTILSFY